MTPLVPIAVFGWIPVVFFLFAVLPPRRAVLAGFLFAWLFLPMAGYKLSGLPDYTKMSATCTGVLLGTLVFNPSRLLQFRPHWADLPMAVWCVVPFLSIVDNRLGTYYALSASFNQTITWGVPYLIGRLYFSDWEGLRELAIAIFIGGLIYVPLCLYEVRMSPQLHRMFYGFHPHSFLQTLRFGGWRPTVFMQHGLMVGMWMTAASLVGVWLWRARLLKGFGPVPAGILVLALLGTAVLCKSVGALALLVLGLGVLFATRLTHSIVPALLLALAPPSYMLARTVGHWDAGSLRALAAEISAERALSLEMRLSQEEALVERALERPLLGWGGFGRNRVRDFETGADYNVTDGFWVIAIGIYGAVGLAAITAVMILPALRLMRLCPARDWGKPAAAGASALAVLLLLYSADCLLNAMTNPIFLLAAGGLCGLRQRFADAQNEFDVYCVYDSASLAAGLPARAPSPTT